MPNGYTHYYYHMNTSAPRTAVHANVMLPCEPVDRELKTEQETYPVHTGYHWVEWQLAQSRLL